MAGRVLLFYQVQKLQSASYTHSHTDGELHLWQIDRENNKNFVW